MLQAKLRYRYFHLSFSAHPLKSIHPRSIFHERAIRLFWFEGTWLSCHPSVQTLAHASALFNALVDSQPTFAGFLPVSLFYFSQLDYGKLEVLRLWVNLLAVRQCDYRKHKQHSSTPLSILTVTISARPPQ